MTPPLVSHSCKGDKAREEGMRHLLSATLLTSELTPPWPHPTCSGRLRLLGHIEADSTGWEGKLHLWVQGSRFSKSSDNVCLCLKFDVHIVHLCACCAHCALVSARCSICTVGSDYASLTLAPYEKFPQSRVSNMCTGPTNFLPAGLPVL